MSIKPTVGSFFSGIGGIDLAFSLAGFDVRYQVEIEPFCRMVLKRHAPQYWPNAQLFEDIRNVGKHNLPAVDVMAGGFPCQSVSHAGKREGIKEGTQSGLWIEFARVIGELRPRIVFLENVRGILSQDGVRVLSDLASMGYDAQWGIVHASDAGAPHVRPRWFCIAVLADAKSERKPIRKINNIKSQNLSLSGASGRTLKRYYSERIFIDRRINPSGQKNVVYPNSQRLTTSRSTPRQTARHQQRHNPTQAHRRQAIKSRTRSSGSVLANTSSKSGGSWRPERKKQSRHAQPQRASFLGYPTFAGKEPAQQRGQSHSALGAGQSLVNPSRAGWQKRHTTSQPARQGHVARRFDTQRGTGAAQPRLGGALPYGVSEVLDTLSNTNYPFWAAVPGQPQFDYEPPRTVPRKTFKNRNAAIKAYGNAVVPQCITPFAELIKQMLINFR